MTFNVFPDLRQNGIFCRGKKKPSKHDLHLLCQFILCNLSEIVNSRLSRIHFNLGFNFFSQKRFVRENKSSKSSCSDLQFAFLSPYTEIKDKIWKTLELLSPSSLYISNSLWMWKRGMESLILSWILILSMVKSNLKMSVFYFKGSPSFSAL